MSLLTSENSVSLWQDIVKHAEDRCAITLKKELETYLVSLLIRYLNKPELTHHVFGIAFLEALQSHAKVRQHSLQHVGDQCLLFAGLFPGFTERRLVKLNYYVDLGKAAYLAVSETAHDLNELYGLLAKQFVVLMDVLQSLRAYSHLTPLEAYEQWHELGSRRAYQILQGYTQRSSRQ